MPKGYLNPETKKKLNKLHKSWRTAVLERDKFCQVCGPMIVGNKILNAHHLIPKEFAEWRWDISNGMILCVTHHTFGKFSAHKNPIWFTMWMSTNKPKILREIYHRINELEGLVI